MGMAASQVRFLTLQDRKSTIGMRLGILSNRKMALTRDMNKAAREYNDAYTETKLQWYDSINGSYTDITYNAMMSPNAGNSYTPYLITDRNTGRVILDGVTNVGTLCSTGGVGTNMASFMSTLTGDSVSTPYLPGTMTYNEEAMAPRIIIDLMGISNFDETKKIYKGVENVDLTDGGWDKVDHSEIVSHINKGITNTLAATTTVLAPVFEFYENKCSDVYKCVLCDAMDLSTGSEYYIMTDNGGGFTTYGTVPENDEQSGYTWYIADAMKKSGYIDSSGNVHNLTADTYWSTLYENGAVVLSRYDVPSQHTNLKGSGVSGINYNGSINNLLGTGSGYLDIQNSSELYTWANKFVTDVNSSGLLKYDMTPYIRDIAMATTMHLRDSYKQTNDDAISNVETHLYNKVLKKPEDLQIHNLASEHYRVNRESLWDNREEFETVVTGREGDPVGGTTNSGTESIAMAIAKQANAIASPIVYYGARCYTDTSANLQNSTGNDAVMAFSVKNMMEVALYYIEKCQNKLADGVLSTDHNNINELWNDNSKDSLLYFYERTDNEAYNEYVSGNGRNYTDPGNYNQGEIEIFQQGETKVASIYSMLSNLEMLDEKVSHYDSTYGNTYGGAWAWVYNGNNNQGVGLKQYLTEILNNGYNSDKSIADAQLIALANINAWMCEALSQDCSTQEGYNQMVEYCSNIWKDLSIIWDAGFQESNWDETQTGATWSQADSGHENTAGNPQYFEGQFYYDDGVDWNRREHLFSQDSEKKVATSRLDIEGQLTVLQLKQFKFYVNLVKECLARGWKDASTNNNSNVDNNSTTLHLQNGTWLINDTTAKSSSRIFEVNNKEAREEALSKYEALQSELKMKEERIDIQMDKLETEQNAINNELDSLQNIISDNIKSTFKIFS